MVEERATSSERLIGSDRVEGVAIYSPDGERIGSIRRLMIEKISGRVVYVVVSLSGFAGTGLETVTVPWGKLTYDITLGGYRTDITEGELRGAPTFAQTSESGADSPLTEADEEELHAHFHIPPYWRAL